MPIGVTEVHEELHQVARRWCEQQCDPAVLRDALDAQIESRPAFWESMGELGWLGLHVAEARGGAGYTLAELAVVVEELGRACAPGPFVPSVIAAALIERGGGEDALIAALAAGTRIGTFALAGPLDAVADGDGLRCSGTLRPVVSGHVADVVVAEVVTADGHRAWCALDLADCQVRELDSLDPTRRAAEVVVDDVVVPASRRLAFNRARVEEVVATIAAVEAVGIAQWCVDTAAEYAKVREQFGRPIGQFQGVKHRCAEMLARVELARAAVWDAARGVDDLDNGASVAIVAAAALAFEAAFENAKDCVQTLGGIGFTWEHDAHMYLRRAMTLRQLVGAAPEWQARAARLALGGARRKLAQGVDLPPEAEAMRADLREYLARIQSLDPVAQREQLAADGYITPAWPAPWGRDAGALELLVIEEEFRAAKVVRPTISIGAWALPNLIVYGTEEQRSRWIMPTLRGEITWCQLFSEPGAGSDLAALSTRAERVDGGWIVNGQKVWSSMAHTADWGILLARTAPDRPKHDGISCFMLDMKAPGVDVRPLRELTGHAMFNEVFFDDVFVPDDCLVGDEHDGWRCARTTLANERVFMGGSSTIGTGVVGVLRLIESLALTDDSRALAEAGELVVTAHALAVLGFRLTLSALRGADPSGSEAAVRKLLGVHHDQRVQEVGLTLAGAASVTNDTDAAAFVSSFLFNRCLSIAGGTTEIQKNVIGERLLGLPRDP